MLQLVEALLNVTYTGEEADEERYHRECVMAVDTVLIPSVDITSQDVAV